MKLIAITNRAFCVIGAALMALPAQAGDFATLNPLGFTQDGSVYAFEEYGIQDGSGFPYANRFYINTDDDSFLSGSPVRVRIDDETATVLQAREIAAEQSADLAFDAQLAANRGQLVGANAISELNAEPFRMVVNPRNVMPPIDDPLEFRLEEIPFPATGTCADLSANSAGFRLVMFNGNDFDGPQTLHEDTGVPASRACPLGYRLGQIRTFHTNDNRRVIAVQIAVRSFGFEGPNYRWLAVTHQENMSN